jgi:hypothetical protein
MLIPLIPALIENIWEIPERWETPSGFLKARLDRVK